jgi:hypothetical protein
MPRFARAGSRRAAFALAAFVVALCSAEIAHAQEILLTGPLAAAPARPRRSNLRENRIDLAVTPGASFGTNDRPSLLAGGEAHYYPLDVVGAGVWGTWAFPVGDGDTRLRAAVAPELVVVPVTGKAVAIDQMYFRFDLHLLGGPALAFTRQGDDDETEWMPMAGIGFRGFCSGDWSKALDYRLLFGDPVRHLVTLSFAYWPFERAIRE